MACLIKTNIFTRSCRSVIVRTLFMLIVTISNNEIQNLPHHSLLRSYWRGFPGRPASHACCTVHTYPGITYNLGQHNERSWKNGRRPTLSVYAARRQSVRPSSSNQDKQTPAPTHTSTMHICKRKQTKVEICASLPSYKALPDTIPALLCSHSITRKHTRARKN